MSFSWNLENYNWNMILLNISLIGTKFFQSKLRNF
uniref:Uncharacterized protein n=1 Tax=Rhizophora mucronata TaxID=61149 RepID=A0A2P2PMH2_RHIMU